MYAREQRVLLRHYLEQGLSKAELASTLGVSRRTLGTAFPKLVSCVEEIVSTQFSDWGSLFHMGPISERRYPRVSQVRSSPIPVAGHRASK
jgi:hypothetical protein